MKIEKKEDVTQTNYWKENTSSSTVSSFLDSEYINNIHSSNISNNTDCKNKTKYSICLDLVEIICIQIDSDTCLKDNNFISDGLMFINVEANIYHKNPNFRNMYKIKILNNEICDIYTNPSHCTTDALQVKCVVSNELLYTENWTFYIEKILALLKCKIVKIHKIAIACDSSLNYKILDLCNRFLKRDTIQINNNNLHIVGKAFEKDKLSYEGFQIGSKKSEKFARIYNKTNEIKVSNKTYITEFWLKNGIEGENITRFEIELNPMINPNKYFSSFHEMLCVTTLNQIFINEVKDWLKFYKVKRKELKENGKYSAIKNVKELKIIDWDCFPKRHCLLNEIPKSLNRKKAASRSISFTLNELSSQNYNSTLDNIKLTQIEYIVNTTKQYDLEEDTIQKINKLKHNRDWIFNLIDNALKLND